MIRLSWGVNITIYSNIDVSPIPNREEGGGYGKERGETRKERWGTKGQRGGGRNVEGEDRRSGWEDCERGWVWKGRSMEVDGYGRGGVWKGKVWRRGRRLYHSQMR